MIRRDDGIIIGAKVSLVIVDLNSNQSHFSHSDIGTVAVWFAKDARVGTVDLEASNKGYVEVSWEDIDPGADILPYSEFNGEKDSVLMILDGHLVEESRSVAGTKCTHVLVVHRAILGKIGHVRTN